MYSGFAVGSALRLESRGIVSMLTCHIQKFIRAFAFGIDSEALQLSPGVSNKLSDFWRGYVRQDDMPSVVLEAECRKVAQYPAYSRVAVASTSMSAICILTSACSCESTWSPDSNGAAICSL